MVFGSPSPMTRRQGTTRACWNQESTCTRITVSTTPHFLFDRRSHDSNEPETPPQQPRPPRSKTTLIPQRVRVRQKYRAEPLPRASSPDPMQTHGQPEPIRDFVHGTNWIPQETSPANCKPSPKK